MTIIKHGVLKEQLSFKCLFCGCEFITDVIDKKVKAYRDFWYCCSCPECRSNVYSLADKSDYVVNI